MMDSKTIMEGEKTMKKLYLIMVTAFLAASFLMGCAHRHDRHYHHDEHDEFHKELDDIHQEYHEGQRGD
ncbi:MAG: hypothetical protein C4532_19060 [Candidatus Abyssobacteria bacterium SURF_17]|jgi:preprotein translocase subunit SecG|uniref:Lipoprotein n=1 Tax=Candidatus Abyssobacteria bacterium SURF_17 TaxID=2093361 RepID=A0A419ENV7_9BACT|nr:MAG: hypothetical protein C4532_19060 [Candidatus Abyssubacteria bacterium SURF_17]